MASPAFLLLADATQGVCNWETAFVVNGGEGMGWFLLCETCSGSELLWHCSFFLFLSFSHVLGREAHGDATVQSFSLVTH